MLKSIYGCQWLHEVTPWSTWNPGAGRESLEHQWDSSYLLPSAYLGSEHFQASKIAVQVWKPPRKSFIHINPESRSIVPGSFKINLNITPFRKNVAKCLTLHYTWSQWGQTFVTEFSSTTVQHNLAYQLNIGTFLPKGYHHLILQTGTQHRKRLEMTQGVKSWQTGRHCPSPQSAQLWFFTDVP